jgi:hypothetical protein
MAERLYDRQHGRVERLARQRSRAGRDRQRRDRDERDADVDDEHRCGRAGEQPPQAGAGDVDLAGEP